MRSSVAVIGTALLLAGCASKAENIGAAYVSPMQYETYNCGQLTEEAQRVSARVAEMTGAQNDKATGDAVKTGVAIVLFWPAAFFMSGDGQTAAELGRLKGEKAAIEQASIRRKCGIFFRQS